MFLASRSVCHLEAEEDGVPRLMPISAGRHGTAPMVVKLPTLQSEGAWIAGRLKEEHGKGVPWRDMAILYRHYDPVCKVVRTELRRAGIPSTWKKDVTFAESQDTVKLLPLASNKCVQPLLATLRPLIGCCPATDRFNITQTRKP